MDNLYFGIINNNNLSSLSGLDNLQLNNANSYFNLNIYNNQVLTFGSVPSICDYLNLGKPHTIYSNSTGCQSASEISAICQSLNTSNFAMKTVEIHPNPTKDRLFISGNQNNEINVYDNLGRKMNCKRITENELSLENLPTGIYTVEVISDRKKIIKKIIKD